MADSLADKLESLRELYAEDRGRHEAGSTERIVAEYRVQRIDDALADGSDSLQLAEALADVLSVALRREHFELRMKAEAAVMRPAHLKKRTAAGDAEIRREYARLKADGLADRAIWPRLAGPTGLSARTLRRIIEER